MALAIVLGAGRGNWAPALHSGLGGAVDVGRNSPAATAFNSSSIAVYSHRSTGRAASEAIAAALPIVRLILGITLLLLGVGTLSCRVEGTAGSGPAGQWVRTADGWERTEMWQDVTVYAPRLHPLVVAAGQGLISVLGLAACRRDDRSGRLNQQR